MSRLCDQCGVDGAEFTLEYETPQELLALSQVLRRNNRKIRKKVKICRKCHELGWQPIYVYNPITNIASLLGWERMIRVEPLDPETRAALVSLSENEHKPIESDAICGPGKKKAPPTPDVPAPPDR